jgi:predicted class III extradiol MEMO1 family dioxygenase
MKFTSRDLELTLALVVLLLPACAAPMATPLAEATGMVLPSPTALPSPTRPPGRVRPAAVVGSWYPGDPEELAGMMDEMLAAVEPVDRAPIGLIMPHTGYAYSGLVAACGFEQLEGKRYEIAVVVASSELSHYPTYDDAHVTDGATLAAIETGDPARVQELLGGER